MVLWPEISVGSDLSGRLANPARGSAISDVGIRPDIDGVAFGGVLFFAGLAAAFRLAEFARCCKAAGSAVADAYASVVGGEAGLAPGT